MALLVFSLVGDLRLYSMIFSYLRQNSTIIGDHRLSLGIFGNLANLWWSSVIFGDFRLSLAIFSDLWWSLETFGDLWRSSVVFGDLWWSLVIFGNLWCNLRCRLFRWFIRVLQKAGSIELLVQKIQLFKVVGLKHICSCKLVELHQEGSAINGATPFIYTFLWYLGRYIYFWMHWDRIR